MVIKVIILAAGYATRMYPLTQGRPKALLPIKGKPIIEFITDNLKGVRDIDEIIILSNDKFYSLFLDWLKDYHPGIGIRIVNDLTFSEDDRLGAMGDLYFAIQKEKIDSDILVVAGDNLFNFRLDNFIQSSRGKPNISVGVYDIGDRKAAHKFGVVNIGSDNRITEFTEKPAAPFSSLVAVGIYFVPRNTVKFIKEYLQLDNSPVSPAGPKFRLGPVGRGRRDALGHFIEWLLPKDTVMGYKFDGTWYDIGDIESYEAAKRSFKF